jgi:hypothetical protein
MDKVQKHNSFKEGKGKVVSVLKEVPRREDIAIP